MKVKEDIYANRMDHPHLRSIYTKVPNSLHLESILKPMPSLLGSSITYKDPVLF